MIDMNRRTKRRTAVGLALALSLALPAIAWAHPLGNFTINHYAGLHVTRDGIVVDYVLDMAEIPAFQVISTIDTNSDGQLAAGETTRYHPAECQKILSDLELLIAGRPVSLTLDSSAIEFPPGAGGLATLRLTCAFRAARPSLTDGMPIDFRDNSYAERLGWREIVVAGEGVSLRGDFTSASISRRLTAYPDDMLSSPLDQRAAHFTIMVTPSVPPGDAPANRQVGQSASRDDVFTRLITVREFSPLTFLFALAVSFVWGALHAMSPGHGKTVVAAYLVGTRGASRHALVLGLTVTLTHTIGVFALGLVTLFASNYILPEQLFPWLSLASGLLVLGIGLTLLIARYRAVRRGRGVLADLHRAIDHDAAREHGHDHHPAHNHDHVHAHAHDQSHDHVHRPHDHTHSPVDERGSLTMRSLLALGVSGGLIPCPTALVVLLSALALGRIGLGLLLIVAFSAGLASALMGVGLLFVHGRRLFDRLPAENRFLRLLPLTGAALVVVTGVVMTAQAFLSVGRLSL